MASGSKPPASLQQSNAAGRESGKQNGLDESPLIPLSLIDAPTQRVYIASSFVVVQTYKFYTFTSSIWLQEDDDEYGLLGKFLLLDFLFVVAVSRLRTPRLDYTRIRWITIFTILCILDWLVTGGWRTFLSVISNLPILGWIADTIVNSWSDTFNRQVSISEHRVRLKDLIRPSHHILGQHTIHVLPFSTAAFSTTTKSTSNIPSCFCLNTDNPKAELFIPILFNNTEPQFISYSIYPIGSFSEEDKVVHNITISKSSLIRLRGKKKEQTENGEDAIDLELDDADDEVEEDKAQRLALVRHGEQQALTLSNRNSQQKRKNEGDGHEIMFNLPIRSPGRIRLERVLDRNHFDARLSRSEILVVECPKMGFTPKDKTLSGQDFCPGDAATMDVWVKGFAPLKLQYSRFSPNSARHDADKQSFTISHISNSNDDKLAITGDERADQIASALRGAKQKQLQSLAQAGSRNVSLPITIDTAKEGKRTYHLESIRDACGNMFEPEDRAMKFYEEVHVHSRPSVVFESCSDNRPIDLLQGGPSREVGIRVEGAEPEEGPFITEVNFEGEGENWSKNVTMNKRSSITIDKPGMYSLGSIKGRFCSGEAGARWSCLARVVPRPTASIQFDAIQDPCSGPVGVKALAVLSGSPPFRVKYRVERKGRQAKEYEEVIKRTREEIEFRPSAEGEVTYTFTGLSDANYQNIDLDGPSFTQVLHPVASASFDGAGQQGSGGVGPTITLQSCQGNRAKTKVALEGVGPFEMKYALRANGGQLLDTRTVKNIQKSPYELDVEVPKEMAEKGGSLNVALLSIKDAKGCERPLTVPDLTVNVFRTKPSASFVDPRRSTMLDDKQIQLPIRVAGEGPWTVRYIQQGKKMEPIEVKLDKAESFLTIAEPGTYEILEVRDNHCPGVVMKSRETHIVTVKPRPTAKFDNQGVESADGDQVLTRSPVCLGTPDSVNLHVQGHFPVSISYRHFAPQGSQAGKEDQFNAAQTRTSLQLDTSTEGRHEYQLMQIGDAVYSPKSIQAARLQQIVYPLPFAGFAQNANEKSASKQVAMCLGEALTESEKGRSIPPVSLSGTPPFTLEYAIKDSTGAIRKTLTKTDIPTHSYTLHIGEKDFPFDVTGKWSVELVRVYDGNGCERSLMTETGSGLGGSKTKSNLEIEVVESANISPVGTRTDYCVGESIDFVLQGSPPWTVTYNFEGQISKATVKTTSFSRIAEQPGTLQVDAIAHQHNRCQTTVKEKMGMKKVIHALPTVHIREGSHFIEDLREGNQAEIVFKLGGEPPFSFTYQRTQAIDRFSKPQVLETHTVTGIEDNQFTIQTAEEGTWSVIWLQDKWCAISIESMDGKKATKKIQGQPRKAIT